MRNHGAQRQFTLFKSFPFQGIVPNPKKADIMVVPTSEGENQEVRDDALSVPSDIRSFRKGFQGYG
ncbi:hypothetical protein J1N35_037492 [Gossypium stocksii]|uniref:Uncharacterized protein n=1 Tax=Gossypium stocksii TaxID=47602 RepID=A0A9D3UK90_9ROSI|nr:hypothetical protein J1N35_037492 [Gossypium stocksii]